MGSDPPYSFVLIRLGPDPENIIGGLLSLWEIPLWDLIPLGKYPVYHVEYQFEHLGLLFNAYHTIRTGSTGFFIVH